MRKLLYLSIAVLVLLLSACGVKSNSISKVDIGVINVHTKEKVSYGMTRSEVEKVLGKGEKIGDDTMFSYEDGLSIIYKNDQLIGIMLSNSSEGIFETVRGIKVGMLASEVLNLYGSENNISAESKILQFIYEANSGKFLKAYPKTSEEIKAAQIYMYDSFIDDNQYIFSVSLVDESALVDQ
ncbi:hypothetical protein MKY95_09965 [Paenibacillus sp. FSL P4-0176]|uniref:hypothetical protein n=1 Tax=Paenibacillus sp. FSL P4-0176 TaxID=2921631 RepID=UPI0030D3C34B